MTLLPKHNGVAECLNCTILKKIQAMLHVSSQPKFLWGEVAYYVMWLKNWIPTEALGGQAPLQSCDWQEARPEKTVRMGL